MEKREDSLREALAQNNEEVERWEKYKKENETAIENLQEFSKHMSVDVMVPIGRKCFMPGKLIHTNEVLVGHYQGYFSKCTAFKAKEICNLRVNRAKEQLKKLEKEAELWTNKLSIPHMEGVVPNLEEREIIEDYNEEHEKQWREEHKKNVRVAKLKEKREREKTQCLGQQLSETPNSEKSDEDIFKLLEEAELMEELEQELDNLKVDEVNDETLKKLMSGELNSTQPKQRISHTLEKTANSNTKSPLLDGVVKKNAAEFCETKSPATNNNNRPNPLIVSNSSDNEEYTELDDMTEEVRVIKEQATFLPASDQVGFYEYQVEIVRTKLKSLKMTNEHDVEEKLHLLIVLDELEDLLALAEEELLETDDDSESINDEKFSGSKAEKTEELSEEKSEKRRIKFALENDTLVFRDNERVSQMLPKELKSHKHKKDIITLGDDEDLNNKKAIEDNPITTTITTVVDKKKEIRDKVQKNLAFVANNQSQVDCDLISKIIDETESMNRTIYITFKHSNQEPATSTLTFPNVEEIKKDFIPEKPSDFYDLYLKQRQEQNMDKKIESKHFYVNSYIGEDEVKAPILRESNHLASYEDPKSTYSLPKSKKKDRNTKITKSILRNKSAVERETHHSTATENTKSAKKRRYSFNEDEVMSAYNKVMNEVMEKPLSAPEPLPNEKFIDAHAPKKRISRFKQSRASGATEQTLPN